MMSYQDVKLRQLHPCLLVGHEDLEVLVKFLDGAVVIPLSPVDCDLIQ